VVGKKEYEFGILDGEKISLVQRSLFIPVKKRLSIPIPKPV